MDVINFLLLLAGLLCFIAAAANVPSRIHLLGLGLAFWIAVPFIAAAQNLH